MDITKLPVLQGVVVFLLVALGAAFVGAFAATTDDDGEANGAPTEPPSNGETPPPSDGIAISMGDNFFDPEEVTLSGGEAVTFSLTNDGAATHNMRVAGEDNEYNTDDDAVSDPEVMTGGVVGTLEWTVPASPGTYDFRCDFHPVEMVGTITVE